MEIIFKNVNYKKKLQDINFEVLSGELNAIYGENLSYIEGLITKKIKPTSGEIVYLGFKRKKIKSVVVDPSMVNFFTTNVKSEINFYCKKNKIKDKSFKIYIEEYMQSLGLTKNILNKKISQLSSSEKYMFYLFLKTLFNFDIILFKNVFSNLDRNNRKIITSLIDEMKRKNKTIIIMDNNIDVLYDLSDKIIIFKDNTILLKGNTKDILTGVETLINNNIDVPKLPLLTYLAKVKKNIKLFYHHDVRDIIKDIYKHV
ncbi:MAG: hypothetical protein ACI4OG_04120 [Bacilli bacterium]